ncbi:ATP-binding protein [Streptomyces sp. NPDC002054]|uniref:ATP-binding protein n=1 Tax=Streptomyces sp. NPDC002054 TaxID=3154663 RepID=UPI0033193F97
MDRTQGHGGEEPTGGPATGAAKGPASGPVSVPVSGLSSGPASGPSSGPASGPTSAPAAGQAGAPAGPPARVVRLTAGDFSLTVNPVDGSEIEPLRPAALGTPTPDFGTGPAGRPAKRDAAARAALAAALPPVPPGPALPGLPLLEREDERERLVRLLGRGRSVRLTGPSGSGRTRLLDAVAEDCATLAPDGLVRLSGHRANTTELLHALYTQVHDADRRRPGRAELLDRVREIGAIVLVDDLDFGGAALDELLRATPECAFLLAATPDTPAPSEDSHLEEVFLAGLGRTACLELLETATGRPLTEEETAWASDLRFASEGLPLRFVQAAALLRQRDGLNRRVAESEEEDGEEPGVFEERPRDSAVVPLPTLAEGAAPAELLAARAGEAARAALRFACALGGEMPHHAHLPALVGDTHADTAVGELLSCGLLTPAGPRYRLAAGVARQLTEAGWEPDEEARTAARHYAWWTGHASVTPERVAAEADAVLAALAGADVVAGVMLARTAAPAFAASLHWGAWERVLRAGAEAARTAGEVAEQAYFHHELGVLALCGGRLDRARAELEASIGLRGALADKHGTVAGRRALTLVADRERGGAELSPPLRLEAPPAGAAAPGPLALPASPSPTPTPTATPSPTPTPTATPSPTPTPISSPTPLSPLSAAPEPAAAGEDVTRVVPVLKPAVPGAPVPGGSEPTTLAEAFEDNFRIARGNVGKQPPAVGAPAAPAAAPARPSRRDPVVLAGAAVLVVALLGTAASFALTSGDGSAPGPQPGTGTATSVSPKNGWNDPAPAPPVAVTGSETPSTAGSGPSGTPRTGPSATVAPSPGPTPSRTPSLTPRPTPPGSRPVSPPPSPPTGPASSPPVSSPPASSPPASQSASPSASASSATSSITTPAGTSSP